MNIHIECPLCGFQKDVAVSFAGKEVACPHCATKFKAPYPQVTILAAPAKSSKSRPLKLPALPASPAAAAPGSSKPALTLPDATQRKATPLPAPAPTTQVIQQRRQLLIGAAGVLVLATSAVAGYFVFFAGSGEPEVAETPPAPIVQPAATVPDTKPDEARLAAEKRAAEEKAAREKAEALARQQEDERKAKADKDRLAKDAERRALEEKKEKERQEKLAREEKERKERLAKEEAARLRAELMNPKLAATPEEVEKFNDKFMNKRLYFDNVRLKEGSLDRHKDLGRFTLSVTSKAGNFYSRAAVGGVFFSMTDQLAADIIKEWTLVDQFPRVRLYCEMRPFERKAGAKSIPEAHIFKIEVYNTKGTLVKGWEEPEKEPEKETAVEKKND